MTIGLASVVGLVVGLFGYLLQSSSPSPAPGSSGAGPAAPCGTINLAINPWVGYAADAAVYSYLARTRLGCVIVPKTLTETESWPGFTSGDVDLILENWGHADLIKQYVTDQKAAIDLGPTGNKGVIGWFVPLWLAQAHSDVLDWRNLNDYAQQFRTSISDGQGQLLDGDPSYVTNDAALVKNLNLNFKVVRGGSESALIQAFREAEQQHQFLLAYFYEPHWFFQQMQLAQVILPPYTPGCDADPATVACGYPPYDLHKIASTRFASSASPAATLAKNFQWTNEDQDSVASSIVEDHLSDDDAAKRWVDANPDKVGTWLAGTR